MHPHQALIERFYTCFQKRDAEGMVACYAPDIVFSDSVFIDLRGAEARGMWRMLCERGKDLEIDFSDVHADDSTGRAHWEADYLFSATGRTVHNTVDGTFTCTPEGLIATHRDRFNFWAWARQALGTPGLLLGWSPSLKRKVRSTAAGNLKKFLAQGG